MIYVYRVTAGQERIVTEMLVRRVKKGDLGIYSVSTFENLKGYILAEAEDEAVIRQAGLRIPHIKGVLKKAMSIKEIGALIEAAKPTTLSLSKGDIVELVSGPFKGEKARVIRIDDSKEEITVELTEVAVPIPVTVKANTVKVYQKAE